MSDEPVNIDSAKLRAAIRRLGPEYVFYMLDDAIDLLPLTELEGIAKKYLMHGEVFRCVPLPRELGHAHSEASVAYAAARPRNRQDLLRWRRRLRQKKGGQGHPLVPIRRRGRR